MVIFYTIWKKYNEIQLTKNKMDLIIRKMTNYPPSPELRRQEYLSNVPAPVHHHGSQYLVVGGRGLQSLEELQQPCHHLVPMAAVLSVCS